MDKHTSESRDKPFSYWESQISVRGSSISSIPSKFSLLAFPRTPPPTSLESASLMNLPKEEQKHETSWPSWLYSHVDWEAKSRWGHCILKLFALAARLAALSYWMFTHDKSMKNWNDLCVFYHAVPGLLGVESAAIIPFVCSPVPYRTLSYIHDIFGIILGTSAAVVLYSNSAENQVILTFISLTVISLAFDLTLHLTTLPKYTVLMN